MILSNHYKRRKKKKMDIKLNRFSYRINETIKHAAKEKRAYPGKVMKTKIDYDTSLLTDGEQKA